MKITITGETITDKVYDLPDKIKVGQMLLLDFGMVIKLRDGKIKLDDIEEIQPFLQWLVDFLKILNVDTVGDDFDQFFTLMQHEAFQPWLLGLFGNLLPSTS